MTVHRFWILRPFPFQPENPWQGWQCRCTGCWGRPCWIPSHCWPQVATQRRSPCLGVANGLKYVETMVISRRIQLQVPALSARGWRRRITLAGRRCWGRLAARCSFFAGTAWERGCCMPRFWKTTSSHLLSIYSIWYILCEKLAAWWTVLFFLVVCQSKPAMLREEVHNNPRSLTMLDFQEEDMLKRLKRYFNFYKHEANGAASYLWPVLIAWSPWSFTVLLKLESEGLKESMEIPFSLKTPVVTGSSCYWWCEAASLTCGWSWNGNNSTSHLVKTTNLDILEYDTLCQHFSRQFSPLVVPKRLLNQHVIYL